MLHRSKSRLFAAAAAAGTVCALTAAGAASAAPATPPWSAAGSVPGAYTNATPGLSAIYRTGQGVRGTFVTWKGQNNNLVMYKFKIGPKWSPTGAVPGAKTTTSPAAAFYIDPHSVDAVVVVWKQLNGTDIYYSQGELNTTGGIKWTSRQTIQVGTDTHAVSYSAPSVLFPINSTHGRVLVAWRGPANHVRYELGAPSGRHFKFDPSHWIGGTSATLTDAAPSLAEISGTGPTSKLSTVYVFWKAPGVTGGISYATTPDNVGTGLAGGKAIPWTLQGSVPGALTTAGPAAASDNVHNTGPLLLAYKGPGGFSIRYQVLTAGVWSPFGLVNGPLASTALGPALLNGGLLANVATSSARIYLHSYNF
ncbi:MAG: hypothetical protein ACLQFR_18470 [Streptosporangiaceae bacterium]